MTRKKKRSPHRDRPAAPTPRPATPPDKVMLALAALGLLITGYLAWEAQEEANGARRELELVRRQQAAKESSRPQPPSIVSAIPPVPEGVPATALPPNYTLSTFPPSR